MQHIFWLLPGVLAGRSGPTRDPWNLAQLREFGIGAVLSVNAGALCLAGDFDKYGLLYKCTSLSPNAPPEPGDLEHCILALPKAFAFIEANVQQGRSTLVHCHSGKDRTGLLMAYYLVRKFGFLPDAAIARVKEVRPIAFTAPGWAEFTQDVLAFASYAPVQAQPVAPDIWLN